MGESWLSNWMEKSGEQKMNNDEIMIDRAINDGVATVIGCTIYFNAKKYKGSRLIAKKATM